MIHARRAAYLRYHTGCIAFIGSIKTGAKPLSLASKPEIETVLFPVLMLW